MSEPKAKQHPSDQAQPSQAEGAPTGELSASLAEPPIKDFLQIAALLQKLPFNVVIYEVERDTPQGLRIKYVNDNADAESGGHFRESVGRCLHEAYPSLFEEVDEDGLLWGLVKTGLRHPDAKRLFEYPSPVKPGTWYQIHLVELPHHHVAAIYEDITDRKEAQRSLLESEERFRNTFEQLAVGMAHVALDGSFIRVNQACTRLFGYSEQELLQRTFGSITHPKDLRKGLTSLRQLEHGEIDSCSFEKRYICKDGTVLWTNLTTGIVRAEDGSPKYLASVIEDISERKRVESSLAQHMQELARSNRDLTEFVNVTAHGLTAPLEAIEVQVNQLQKQLQGTLASDAEKSLQLLSRRVQQLGHRLHGLQRYAQVGSKRHKPDHIVLPDLIDDLIAQLDIPAGFAIKVKKPVPTLLAFRAPLEQVLQSLLLNAYQHHDKDVGTIEICAKEREQHYELCVRDDGPGIPQADQPGIFQSLDEVHSGGGPERSGMGLSIVKKIVEQQKGEIWLESSPNKGTAFTILWPFPDPT